MTQINSRSGEGLTLNQAFTALSHPVRRRILVTIMERNIRMGDAIGTEELMPNGEDRDRIEVQYYHTHLPHLDEAGFVDWNRRTDTVTRGSQFEQIRPLLRVLDSNQDKLPDDWP